MTFCTQCGKELADGLTLCEECATKQTSDVPETAAAAPQFHPNYVAPPVQAGYASSAPAFHIPMTQEQLPEEFKPLGAWAYFGYSILFNIPLVGFILLIVFSLGGTRNVNLRNFARSFFCGYLLAIIAVAVMVALVVGFGITLGGASAFYN